jgi:methyltransferase (TIGR00027 family)
MTVPGLLLHFVLRKRFIEHAVREQLAAGCEQVVVVGAGFDTLAVRLGTIFSGARFIEIDHPATQAVKHAALARGGAPANVDLLAADLARVELADVLAAASAFRPDAPSVFVIEGLLMYLREPEVARVFVSLRRLQPGAGAVVFTVMEPAPDGAARFHNATPLVGRLLGAWNEPFRSRLPRGDVGRFLARAGLQLRTLADSDDLRARYLSRHPAPALARGEIVVVATR